MKKTASSKAKEVKELRAEYHFDYRQSRPNRLAEKVDTAAVVVVLDPDVAEVFTTPESDTLILPKIGRFSSESDRPNFGRNSVYRQSVN